MSTFTLAQFLYFNLDDETCAKLLELDPDNPAANSLKNLIPGVSQYELLATCLYSGCPAMLPKFDMEKGGVWPAIEENDLDATISRKE